MLKIGCKIFLKIEEKRNFAGEVFQFWESGKE